MQPVNLFHRLNVATNHIEFVQLTELDVTDGLEKLADGVFVCMSDELQMSIWMASTPSYVCMHRPCPLLPIHLCHSKL